MLTIETERRVTKLLISLSHGELSCLHHRHNLITHQEFNGFQCFKHLDKNGKEYIDAYDIVDFMKSNNAYCTIDEAEMIILFYDKDNSNHIAYSNFSIMLYSGIGFEQSLSFERSSLNSLSPSMESLLFKVLADELTVIRETKELLESIVKRFDFDVIDLYKAMEGRSCITEHNLIVFLKRNGRQLSKEEMSALFNRLNIEKSGGISLRELKRLFDFPLDQEMKGKKTWKNYDNKHLSSSLSIFNHSKNISSKTHNKTLPYLESITINNVIDNAKDNTPKRYFTPDFPCKPFSLEESYRNELLISKTKLEHETLNPPEYKEIFGLLKILVDTEKMIEQSKNELALRADFNIEDAFCLFASKEPNHITGKELYYGLSALEIGASSDDIKMLMKKYDLRNEGLISYRDLFEMLIPFNKEYRTMVGMRLPANYSPKYDKTDVFLDGTKYYLRNLLRIIINQEKIIFNIKERQQPQYRLYIEKIFKEIDNESKGFFTPKQLGGYLKDHLIILTQNESDLLFIRFDRLREGRVSLRDFIGQCYN